MLAQQSTNDLPSVDLKLTDYLQQVLQHNQTLQAQLLDAQANKYKQQSEKGIFEPDIGGVASYTYQWDREQNTTIQQTEQGGSQLFADENSVYDGGVEELIPTGAKIQIGSHGEGDLYNNVRGARDPSAMLVPTVFFANISLLPESPLTQPLLKNAWLTPVMVDIRLAALDSDIAFQEYRRQLMLTIFQAEGAYWNLYFAQEQIHFFDDSVSAAQRSFG